jgi:hypothetical protein
VLYLPNILQSNKHLVVGPARGWNLKISTRAGLGPPFCDF